MLDIDVYSGAVQLGEWRDEPTSGMINFVHQGGNRHANAAIHLCDEWCVYFNDIGAVPWQDKIIK